MANWFNFTPFGSVKYWNFSEDYVVVGAKRVFNYS